MDIREIAGKEIIIFDGALGTLLQSAGLKGGQLPEEFNFSHPEIVKNIYGKYIEAGSRVISSNSFCSNMLKLAGRGFSDEESVTKAVSLAKEAVRESGKDIFTAHDIGPTGELMKPLGNLEFDKAYEIFKRQVIAGKNAGADFHFFETFSDIVELRAGVIAAKENSELPVFCSVTIGEGGRMLLGTDPETAVYILQDMCIDAIGINCSLGPVEVIPLIKRMLAVSKIPVLVQPNAGMPIVSGDETIYDIDPEEFTECIWEMIESGVAMAGGCCGTTPEHIKALADRINKELHNDKAEDLPGISGKWYKNKKSMAKPTACTPNRRIEFGDETIIIGERINPTGRKDIKSALKSSDRALIENEAVMQQEAGAHIIGLNVGAEDVDEVSVMADLSESLSDTLNIPLQIDSSDPRVIEAGVRKYPGKPVINSVNGDPKNMDRIFPLVKKYGTAVIALTLDENGVPESVSERLKILEKILKEADKYGITRDRIIVDTLALTVSADPLSAVNALKAIELVTERYGVSTILGASNISYGLPNRDLINRAFLSMSIYAGISSVITDPTKRDYVEEIKAADVLSSIDRFAENYICYNKEAENGKQTSSPKTETKKADGEESLSRIILEGRESQVAEATKELLSEKKPIEIIDEVIVPCLEIIGDDYEEGITFLPQMIKSAETVKKVFDVLKPIMTEDGDNISKGKIVIATVKDDIHDIGKNIVKTILENYGYEMIDLGKDVDPNEITETIKRENIKLAGLSALMTTTMVNMKSTIEAIASEGLDCRIIVGGAVLTREYADSIGADFYCETAMDAVRAAEKVFGVLENKTEEAD